MTQAGICLSDSDKREEYDDELPQIYQRTKNVPINYYKVLGVPRDVNEVGIKKAYRKLALIVHPDKNKATEAGEAGEAFKVVAAAYACLKDASKRRTHDESLPTVSK